MTKRMGQKWSIGSIFEVPQKDNQCCLGQVVDLLFPNVPSCAFYNVRFPRSVPPQETDLAFEKLIAALSTTREQLDRGVWKVTDLRSPVLERQFWPNEQLREVQWVGAKTYGAGIIDRFLNAFYGLAPWDYYSDPAFFDKLLFSLERKPKNLVFKK